jgi:hypothetical protein
MTSLLRIWSRIVSFFSSSLASGGATVWPWLGLYNVLQLVVVVSGAAVAVLLDFSKTFDSMSHDLLLRKLRDLFGLSSVAFKLFIVEKIITFKKFCKSILLLLQKGSKKPQKRKKPGAAGNESQPATTQSARAVVYQEINIWNFEVIERFLQVLHNE